MNYFLRFAKSILAVLILFLLYVAVCILHGTYTDFNPVDTEAISIHHNHQDSIIPLGPLRLVNWNIGYAGLGATSDFFYDDGQRFFSSGGKMVCPEAQSTQNNLEGISNFLQKNPADFVLLQEVDHASNRSHYINQHQHIAQIYKQFSQQFALNYVVERVPIPLLEPWNIIGKVKSGLSSYSKYKAYKAERHPFPGSYDWPNYIFHLDRCMLVQYFHTFDSSKKLIVINTHNSAYDKGQLKAAEMAYFKKFVLQQYQKGYYVVVGGDWNQSPPDLAFDAASKAVQIPTDSTYSPANIPIDFLPDNWQWAFDSSCPTNRALKNKLKYGKTAVSLVDYYLLSPNIKINSVKGHNLKFANSDHNPVSINIELVADSSHNHQ